jgi:hypothetical protein
MAPRLIVAIDIALLSSERDTGSRARAIDDDLASTDTARFGPEFLSLFKG